MNDYQMKCVLTVLNKEFHNLTHKFNKEGDTLGKKKMKSSDNLKAIAIQEAKKVLQEFGPLEMNIEDLTEWERHKYEGTIKHFTPK
jgi:hypothetical protein